MKYHSTAIISENAKIAQDVQIGSFAMVEDNVQIGANTVIEPYARVCSGSVIGENCKIGSFAMISGEPQDLHFDSSIKSGVQIGDNTVVRENSTIHRATVPNGFTVVGKNCFLMASSHIGHDVVMGDNCIEGCFAAVAGFTKVGDNTFISGGVMLHQKMRVGKGSMLSGNGRFSYDIPPYVNALERNNIQGLNLIGLKRRGTPAESIRALKAAYMFVCKRNVNMKNLAIEAMEKGLGNDPYAKEFLEFFTLSEGRNFCSVREK